MKKSSSYPFSLRDQTNYDLKEHRITIHQFKEKDFDRTERLAQLGSQSSFHIVSRPTCLQRCCRTTERIINYLLERGEESTRLDLAIQEKSYAGFYFFVKWFVRSVFFLIFTTFGTIGGKEIGCLIKDHESCQNGVIELTDSSPHLVASMFGMMFGLLAGQWIGRFVWDHIIFQVRRCLRKLEKYADRSKLFLFLMSVIIYIFVTSSFSLMFFFFVDLGISSEHNAIVGASIGAFLGLLFTIFAYLKRSDCQSGQDATPPLESLPEHLSESLPELEKSPMPELVL